MGKVQAAAQPEMENLLASIKKAIHDETGTGTPRPPGSSIAEGTIFAGSMREMRVKASDEQIPPAQPVSGEILDLRNKVASHAAPREPMAHQPAPALASPARAGSFAGLLGGAPRQAEQQPVRRLADPIRERVLAPLTRGTAGSLNEQDYPTLEPRDPPRPVSRETWEQPVQEYLPAPEAAPARALAEPAILSGEASAAASAAFGRLGETLLSRALNDRPIEDLTRELLRGMLKQWLDENLPDMVERLVREEIARVARRGGR